MKDKKRRPKQIAKTNNKTGNKNRKQYSKNHKNEKK